MKGLGSMEKDRDSAMIWLVKGVLGHMVVVNKVSGSKAKASRAIEYWILDIG